MNGCCQYLHQFYYYVLEISTSSRCEPSGLQCLIKWRDLIRNTVSGVCIQVLQCIVQFTTMQRYLCFPSTQTDSLLERPGVNLLFVRSLRGVTHWCSTALLLLEGVTTRVLCGENRTNYASCSPYFLVTLATIATLGIIARPPLGSRQLSAIIPPSPPSLPPPTSV